MTYNELLDNLLIDLGGCGIYQILLAAIVHVGKLTATWSMITMTFAGQNPGFQCTFDNSINENITGVHAGNLSLSDTCDVNGTTCHDHIYNDHMRTIVSQVRYHKLLSTWLSWLFIVIRKIKFRVYVRAVSTLTFWLDLKLSGSSSCCNAYSNPLVEVWNNNPAKSWPRNLLYYKFYNIEYCTFCLSHGCILKVKYLCKTLTTAVN